MGAVEKMSNFGDLLTLIFDHTGCFSVQAAKRTQLDAFISIKETIPLLLIRFRMIV